MTIRELLLELKHMDPDAQVVVQDADAEGSPLIGPDPCPVASIIYIGSEAILFRVPEFGSK